MTLADVALGYATAFSTQPPAKLLTTTLTTDFAGAARVGDWLESRVEIQQLGSRLAFANCYLLVGGRRIVRASAVFVRDDGGLEKTTSRELDSKPNV